MFSSRPGGLPNRSVIRCFKTRVFILLLTVGKYLCVIVSKSSYRAHEHSRFLIVVWLSGMLPSQKERMIRVSPVVRLEAQGRRGLQMHVPDVVREFLPPLLRSPSSASSSKCCCCLLSIAINRRLLDATSPSSISPEVSRAPGHFVTTSSSRRHHHAATRNPSWASIRSSTLCWYVNFYALVARSRLIV